MRTVFLLLSALLLAGGAAACGSSSSPPTNKNVTLSWNANRESGVNKAGGGYRISISGMPVIDVPYASGSLAPTSKTVLLAPGSYTATIRAYAALDASGGTTGTESGASQSITINVP
ncbi:MAG TPA: hypothetical protein VFM53_11420 [Anaeromyxobacteraceae bacterium]|nr:hypothetical protein [Anaeromyxobacteraceae bacterium]